jgi:hypothetical protein
MCFSEVWIWIRILTKMKRIRKTDYKMKKTRNRMGCARIRKTERHTSVTTVSPNIICEIFYHAREFSLLDLVNVLPLGEMCRFFRY